MVLMLDAMRALILFSLAFAASISASACKKNSQSKNGSASVEPTGGEGEKTVPQARPLMENFL